MTSPLEKRRYQLRMDFEQVVGKPFEYFYCPILSRDEDVPLCKAHIVNTAITGSGRWTLQRKDVDNFFGSAFESDFANIRHRGRRANEIIMDPSLAANLRLKFLVDGRKVEHYIPKGSVPNHHTLFVTDGKDGPIKYALKITPTEVGNLANANWQVHVEKDLRISALVSVLKAAHLTMFDMLGYRYALSPGGQFLGKIVLGNYFDENVSRPKKDVVASAVEYFREFAHLVRPVIQAPEDTAGTAVDHRLFFCKSGRIVWSGLVLVRTGRFLHAALVPMFQDPIGAKHFIDFISGPEEKLEANITRFDNDRWLIAKETKIFMWPKTGILYPE